MPGHPRHGHHTRPALDPRFPVHVIKWVRRDVTGLRSAELYGVLQPAFVYGSRRDEFRICQFSIQDNHIHLICEASDATQLARGIQGWSVRAARALNRHLGRASSVFDDRYHVEILRTPAQTRSALAYVLHAARLRGATLDPRFGGVDPFSSAWWFDGWDDASWRDGVSPPELRTVAAPETSLLRTGWRRVPPGLISITETPPARALTVPPGALPLEAPVRSRASPRAARAGRP